MISKELRDTLEKAQCSLVKEHRYQFHSQKGNNVKLQCPDCLKTGIENNIVCEVIPKKKDKELKVTP